MTPATRSARPRAAAKRYGGRATVDDYLAAVPNDVRTALAKLRKTIKAAAPRATEGISYQVPVFKLDGKPLVGFGAATAHCTFFVMSTSVAMRARLAELKELRSRRWIDPISSGQASPSHTRYQTGQSPYR
jgi:hypothetical protein